MSDLSTIQLVEEVRSYFQSKFGSDPDVVVAAPGRVNLIGEHIDYCDGFVLPMAIDRYTVVAAKKTDAASPETAEFYSIDMDSNVPIGGGLSSSASLEVAVGTMIEAITGTSIDPVAKGLVCQKAEHDFVGVPCGIMDQFASALCQKDHVLLLDCQDQSFQQIPFTNPEIAVLIINSEVKHELSGGEYAQRRSSCEKALRVLESDSFRDVTMEQVNAKRNSMDPVVFKRAKHVVGEIARTTDAATALKSDEWEKVGELMYASHNSLRDDFEVSCKELDILVELARKTDGVIGSRMTGGGFGGCTVTLVERDKAAAATESICNQYEQATGVKPTAFVTRPSQGAHRIV